ncbi:MAG: hypothetical protein H6Q36_322 [Chloroflexi bacterium]|jgi:hypothetical protein|nr:hypothetical protein [Chloroflexota bacterium]
MTDTTHVSDEIQGSSAAGATPPDEPADDDGHAAATPTDSAHGDHDHGEPLGPADWGAWTAGILGVAAGLLVAVCLWLSTSGL